MKKNLNRISITKERVEHQAHHVGLIGLCLVCGKQAHHKVRGLTKDGEVNGKYACFCTEHFTRIFKLPPNRFPKSKKNKLLEKANTKGIQHFALRQHMDLPYQFQGERIASHHVKFGDVTWYFALYWRDGGSANPIDHVVSLTRAWSKKHAVHQVMPMEGKDEVIEKLKYLIHVHDGIRPVSNDELFVLTMEGTKFIEKCYATKPINGKRLNKWVKRMTAESEKAQCCER